VQTIEILLAGLVVGLDNFAAAAAIGSLRGRQSPWRIALVFAAFGAAAPLVGALIGAELSDDLAGLGEVVGAAVLGILGLWTLRSSRAGAGDDRKMAHRATEGIGLLAIAAGLSVDNLVVGFSLGLHGIRALPIASSAGVWVLILTLAGLRVGGMARERWERRAHVAAGILLLVLAAAIGFGIL
jgi:manganese efflux pump family protein